MISEVVMPQMGADMTEGTLLRWLKQEGDQVARGDIIAEIETDKANVEIEAFEGGVFRKAIAGEGDTVQVGEVIAVIAAPEDDISKYTNGARAAAATTPAPAPAAAAKPAPAREPEPSPGPVDAAAAASVSPTIDATPGGTLPPTPAAPDIVRPPQPAAAEAATRAPGDGRLRASPLARKIADERGVDLRQVRGSGPGGRIVKRDVDGAVTTRTPAAAASAAPPRAQAPRPAAPTPVGDVVVTPSRMRQRIAARMAHSKREAPHYYLLVDIDMTDAMAFRSQVNETLGEDVRVSVNDLIVRACTLALQQHPEFNATMAEDGAVTQHGQQHVCIAIAMDDGLIAPAITDTGSRTLVDIARASKDLADRAKNGALRPEEITVGTFSITNLGAYGIETLVGIIQPPQTAILGVGTVMTQPAVRDNEVVVRQLMKVALSADHRVTDGAQGAQFLSEIKRLLEHPLLLVL